MPVGRMIAIVFLLLCSLLAAQCTLAGQALEVTRVENAPQAGGTTTKAKVGQILGDLLILSPHGFPLSMAEGWAVADPTKAKKQPKTELSESLEVVETPGKSAPAIGDEAPASSDDWTISFGPLADWGRKVQGVPGVLVAGGCLTAAVVVVGGVAFALRRIHYEQHKQSHCNPLHRGL